MQFAPHQDYLSADPELALINISEIKLFFTIVSE